MAQDPELNRIINDTLERIRVDIAVEQIRAALSKQSGMTVGKPIRGANREEARNQLMQFWEQHGKGLN